MRDTSGCKVWPISDSRLRGYETQKVKRGSPPNFEKMPFLTFPRDPNISIFGSGRICANEAQWAKIVEPPNPSKTTQEAVILS